MKKVHFILFIICILAGIMLNAGCNLTIQYDVRGVWIFTGNYDDIDFNKTLNFKGDNTQGTVTAEFTGIASYSSDGYTVEFDLPNDGFRRSLGLFLCCHAFLLA